MSQSVDHRLFAFFHLTKFAVVLGLTVLLAQVLAGNVAAAAPTITLELSPSAVYQNQTFTVEAAVAATDESHSAAELRLSFDPTELEVIGLNPGELYSQYTNQDFDNTTGTVTLDGDFFGGSNFSSGTFATVTFRALTTGSLSIDPTGTALYDQNSNPISLGLTSQTVTATAALSNATLTLATQYPTWATSDTQWVTITLDTQGNDVAGVDVVLEYPSNLVSYQNIQFSNIFPFQPTFFSDPGTGRVYFSLVAQEGQPINTSGEIARIQFATLSTGTAEFAFNWTLNSTTDTNIVSYDTVNTDLLSVQPNALAVTIGAAGSLNFQYTLLDFIGTITNTSGTITVQQTNSVRSFNNPLSGGSNLGEYTGLALGTLTFGNSYDLILRIPGYLAKKQLQTVQIGVNPSTGFLDFGNLTPGDVNGDNVVNTFDLNQLFNNWNISSNNFNTAADLNGDGRVNSFDVSILYAYFNQSVTL